MTEKRFKFVHDNVGLNLKTPIMDNDKIMNIGEVLDEMNALHEEKEALKLNNKLLLEEMKEIRDKLTVYLQIKGIE